MAFLNAVVESLEDVLSWSLAGLSGEVLAKGLTKNRLELSPLPRGELSELLEHLRVCSRGKPSEGSHVDILL